MSVRGVKGLASKELEGSIDAESHTVGLVIHAEYGHPVSRGSNLGPTMAFFFFVFTLTTRTLQQINLYV